MKQAGLIACVWQESPCLLVLTVANPPGDHDPNVWDGTLQLVKSTQVQDNFSHPFRQQMLETLRWMGTHPGELKLQWRKEHWSPGPGRETYEARTAWSRASWRR